MLCNCFVQLCIAKPIIYSIELERGGVPKSNGTMSIYAELFLEE